ncbi:MAG: hypothetical protein Q9227_008821 [Pyrenula ochraceoflavens]
MAIINTVVAKSQDVKDAALNINAKAFEVRRTLAAVWDLKPTDSKPPIPAETLSLDMKNPGQESVVGGDERVRVPDHDFAPGGKYRSIVKIFTHYEFQKPDSWAHGTGWLIRPDVFVTAGHCCYDWSHKMGRATEVKAYIGYKGKQSEKDSNVQFRHVKRIVTTEGWVKTKGQKSFDVSFMQVDKPFAGITPIQFMETPARGNMEIGGVGYPADLFDKQTGEHGAYMYEMFLPTEFDLAQQADTMLEYQIDTFGGNSGSPVFRKSDLVSIGAHVYGGILNSASVIGRYGNPYQDYLAAFALQIPNTGLNLVPVTGNSTISAPVPSAYGNRVPSNGMVNTEQQRTVSSSQLTAGSRRAITSVPLKPTSQKVPPSTTKRQEIASRANPCNSCGTVVPGNATTISNQVPGVDEETFIDVLKTAASVGAPVLQKILTFGLPMALGPIGAPIGALAGFVLNAAGNLAANFSKAESALDTPNLHEGSMERAILAEAVLMAMQSTEMSQHVEESIFTDMRDSVMKVLPIIRKAAPHVMGAMMETALRMALDSLQQYNTKVASGAESFTGSSAEQIRPTFLYSPSIDDPTDPRAEAFLANVHAAISRNLQESAVDGETEEAWIDIVKAGIRFAGQGVLAAAEHGLPILLQALGSLAESSLEDAAAPGDTNHGLSADALAQRAVVAEAALQAVMKLPPEQLQEEGFFELLASAVQQIAPIVIKVAPSVISAINPVVGGIVSSLLKQESFTDNGGDSTGRETELPRPIARKEERPNGRLTKQRSLAAIRSNLYGTSTGSTAERQRRYDQGIGPDQIGVAN